MNELKIDFRIDIITGKEIPAKKVKRYIRQKNLIKRRGLYLSEIADIYYQKKYGKNILEVLDDYYDIPRCPITGDLVTYKLAGSIIFGKFGQSIARSHFLVRYVAKNNESFKRHVERMKIERKGSGNPMFGKAAWNKGLTKETDKRLVTMSESHIGKKPSKETRKKMAESAKRRKIHGHTDHKHTKKSKDIIRRKTIARLVAGKYPQTNSKPHRKLKELLKILFPFNLLKEEYPIGKFIFDFKIPEHLIEVQGDYFHCNPDSKYAIPKTEVQKANVKRDKAKRYFVKTKTLYKLIEIWEKDINENFSGVAKCLRKLQKSMNLVKPRCLI